MRMVGTARDIALVLIEFTGCEQASRRKQAPPYFIMNARYLAYSRPRALAVDTA
jgi:hypothetical protein